MNSAWSWWISFLMWCCNWFDSILLKIFASMFIMDIGLKFSFLVVSLLSFGIIWWWSHKMIWEGFSLFVLFGSVSEEMIPAPLFMSGRISLWTCLDLDFFWLVVYYLLPQLQPLLLVCSRLQLLPRLSLGGCKCLGIYPFILGLLVCVHRVVSSNLWW